MFRLADAVILAGGAGTRLWPLSRSSRAKHLLPLVGERTLLRATYERARMVADRVLVVTERSQLEGCREQLPELADSDWISEPGRRGTAACLALAASLLPPDGVMVSLHADHLIPDADDFAQTVRAALQLVAQSGSLVTLGLRPRNPSTAFGYIHKGAAIDAESRLPAYRSAGFVEKPELPEAERMVASGEYLWNTGIFAWRNSTFLAELQRHAPQVHAGALAAAGARAAGDLPAYEASYLATPEMAVDHAVMERTRDLIVLEAGFAWSDVGSWSDLAAVLPARPDGNIVIEGEVVAIEATGNVVRGLDRPVALVGVSSLVIIDGGDCLLVSSIESSQKVKAVVAALRERGRQDLT